MKPSPRSAPVLSGAMPSGQVHGDDLVAAMERTPDQVAFVSGQEELQLILAHPFAAWRTFLHPSQREIAYRPSYSGPAQVTGGPGTGKTVTVLHRAAFLAARAASAREPTGPGAAGASAPDAAPILLTTFNGNLADALQAQPDLLIRDPRSAPPDPGPQRGPAGVQHRQGGPRHSGHRG